MSDRLELLIERTAQAWSVDATAARELMTYDHKKALRINPLKAKKSSLKDIKESGVSLELITWCANAYSVVTGYEGLSKSNLFSDGVFILQDAASFIPVLALDPKPGESVLDICAAPGGKTTHIAALAKNKAQITANDTSRARFFKMRDMFTRMNVNAETTLYDGRVLAKQLDGTLFDKILLDAPCSGEAAIQPNDPKTYEQWSIAKIKRLSRLQEQLLLTAYDLLKPGGTLVYSTCTISPEENELVVNHLLKRRNAQVQPININIDGVMPGITHWNGKQLDSAVSKTYRLLPTEHHEAFYTAKITKPLQVVDDSDVYFG